MTEHAEAGGSAPSGPGNHMGIPPLHPRPGAAPTPPDQRRTWAKVGALTLSVIVVKMLLVVAGVFVLGLIFKLAWADFFANNGTGDPTPDEPTPTAHYTGLIRVPTLPRALVGMQLVEVTYLSGTPDAKGNDGVDRVQATYTRTGTLYDKEVMNVEVAAGRLDPDASGASPPNTKRCTVSPDRTVCLRVTDRRSVMVTHHGASTTGTAGAALDQVYALK